MIELITVQTKEVYGHAKIYPVCETAQRLANLAGTKTLTPQAIKIIKELGYGITEQPRNH